MDKLLLLGDEAFAQGALDAGLSGAFGYPGTPSTEIIEYIQRKSDAAESGVKRDWSANEKTAMETALGMSYTGKRAIVTMKHVGLNVAADPFMNSAITGVYGGLLIAVADDPSMHSSQNEQDSRFYGKFAMIPVLEPSNQQEAYDMARAGFELSERFHLPVMVRLTTRLAHSRSLIVRQKILKENPLSLPEDPNQFMLLPAFARKKYRKLLEQQDMLVQASEKSPYNQFVDGPDHSLGIVACGLAYNYLMENFPESACPYPVVKIGQYPLPEKMLHELRSRCDTLLILEEGMPVVEEMIRGVFGPEGLTVKGRLDGTLPRDGELNPGLVRKALELPLRESYQEPEFMVPRPPALCAGCPHQESFKALNKAMEPYGSGHVFSDIGCYTLGFLPPYNAINTCVDMGASFTMAVGAAEGGLFPSVGVIGDSTFGHSGLTGLSDATFRKSNVVLIILDNDTTAMTGMQDSVIGGKIEAVCESLGVEKEHIRVLTPLPKEQDQNVQALNEEIEYPGVSVVIFRRPCIHVLGKRRKEGKA